MYAGLNPLYNALMQNVSTFYTFFHHESAGLAKKRMHGHLLYYNILLLLI